MDQPDSQQPPRVFPVSKHIKSALEERGWLQADLAFILGWTASQVNSLMVGRKKFSPEIAQELAVAFRTTPDYWLNIDNAYRLSQADYVDEAVVRRSILYSFPIKEMQKRGWISDTVEVSELESELKRFFGENNLSGDLSFTAESELPFDASFKRTQKDKKLNNAELAWIARARQLASVLHVAAFSEASLVSLGKDLRRFAAKSQAVHRVPELLAKYGIRYVVVEPLPRVKIDGAAFWLDLKSPVIAMSIRFDNIGSFWFTLMHEVDHIKHKDAFSFDDLQVSPTDEAEIRANRNAAEILVPQLQLDAFIKTYSPQYSEARINNLATQLQIHPGIIVGQLHHRNEIGYNKHRKLMASVRELATKMAFTDGWGRQVPHLSS